MEHRRSFLKTAFGLGLLTLAADWLKAGQAWAAAWNQAAFESKAVPDAIEKLGARDAADSTEIIITAPDVAENSAVVPVTVLSRLSNTRTISLIAEGNPMPLAATFEFGPDSEPYVSTRLKLGQSSRVRVIVNANGRFFQATREIKVTAGACG